MSQQFKVHWNFYMIFKQHLTEITGMDEVTFQPAAGAHGEWTGLMMIRAYHEAKGDVTANKSHCSRFSTWYKPSIGNSCGI